MQICNICLARECGKVAYMNRDICEEAYILVYSNPHVCVSVSETEMCDPSKYRFLFYKNNYSSMFLSGDD